MYIVCVHNVAIIYTLVMSACDEACSIIVLQLYRPVVFSIEDNPCYTADFVLATLSESDTHRSPSQQRSSQGSNGIPSRDSRQPVNHTTKHSQIHNKRKKTNHPLPHSQHDLNKTGTGMESLEHKAVPPSPESVIVQSDEEHQHSVIDLTVHLPDQLSIAIPDDVFNVQSDEDFVEGTN